jgi:hypothetical protein
MQGNNPVNETIDERILRLLGLLEVFDLDYDTYKTLLKEKLVQVTSSKEKIPAEEFELLKNEFKRVRSKTGRFIPKKKKPITANNVSNLNSFSKKLLKGTATTKEQPQQKQDKSPITSNSLLGIIKSIHKLVENIHGAIQYQTNLFRNQYERDRRESERLRRGEEEGRLETKKDGFLEKAKKILAPVESIFDRILRFLLFTLLGRAFKLFMDWASDPENRKKLESIGRFLKDWWPALLAAWFAFTHPLGKFIRFISGTIIKLTWKLAKFAIPKLLSFIKANPKALAAAAIIGGGAYLATKVTGQQEAAPIQAENKAKVQRGEALDIRGVDTPIDKAPSVGDMGPSTPFGLLQGANTGGIINPLIQGVGNSSPFSGIVDKDTGETVSGAGPDTQFLPIEDGGGAVLQRGEVVLQKGARERMIQQAGIDPLAFNVGSNANKPRKINSNILGASLGGLVGLHGGGMVGRPGGGSPSMSLRGGNFNIQAGRRSPYGGRGSKKKTNPRAQYYMRAFRNNLPSIKNQPGGNDAMKQRFSLYNMSMNPLSYNMSMNPLSYNMSMNPLSYNMSINPLSYNSYNVGINPSSSIKQSLFDLRSMRSRSLERQGRNNEASILNRYNISPTNNIIKENTGLPNKGSSSDRRLLPVFNPNFSGFNALQPGEVVINREAVNYHGGVNIINKLNSTNNNGIKLIDDKKYNFQFESNAKKPNITPPSKSGGMVPITMPPIRQSSGGIAPTQKAKGSVVPPFSAISPVGLSVRVNNADIYGIMG